MPRSPEWWLFDYGIASDTHVELANRGTIVKMLGTLRGFGWKLSDDGLAEVSALVSAFESVARRRVREVSSRAGLSFGGGRLHRASEH